MRPLYMRNSMGEELTQENGIEGRWKEYFVQLLNHNEIKDLMRARIGENEKVVRKVVREEIMGAVKKMNGGKTADMHDLVMEMLKMEVVA